MDHLVVWDARLEAHNSDKLYTTIQFYEYTDQILTLQ